LLIISLALWSSATSNVLKHPILITLGTLSFTLYLVHTLVIASAGSSVMEILYPVNPLFAATSAIFLSISFSFLWAYPLAVFDTWWVKSVSRCVTNVFPRAGFSSSGVA
jgi:peptidoglycan/LPS O-acetylase OafA/YrhL